ncbi:acetyl-CoA carboxylase carboxyltransferase subunit alpha [Halobacteriovorax marinus]|uniref:Acetyl-coenzyme A carboxylase carboxyl transferase subunit alpha n=1 Tax=Halobacteriovorax marinus (strain ATCC BAA-682 / DSM 15412 / SJ) TaxID=862908 RepID=E1X4H2_HALMS|nr:acetyl-CoA carboxylase carboxyltransferase subunit alpha [Halobacteriovorax marinus]ATH06835.1 acetyl-CoA carboxylase carboxyltransferase subunit alpha [Halobacteriovorax marinus]CBW25402.1 acetyl-coenzyme A carboxylase carboxyl transferase subunit alpha [Halobacteriovorax marinus SJ]
MSDLLNNYTLEFEKPVRDLENQIKELQEASLRPEIDISKEIKALQKKVSTLIKDIYANLSPWERVQLSRHPNRPHTIDYINEMVEDFKEVCGDRHFANDPAIITGFGKIDGKKVAIVGIEKGRKTKEKVHHNFGMPRPEGYRKALRVMQTAGRFGIPIVTFVDTPGAYPGIGAEERGQACAIAENLAEMFDIKAPIISVVIGEGGSGGALGIAIADRVMMMEYSIYSVISPESCASILWADPKKAEDAANSLQLVPSKALELKVVDSVIEEPIGGAHKDKSAAFEVVKKAISKELKALSKMSMDKVLEQRFEKFREMGNQTITTIQ